MYVIICMCCKLALDLATGLIIEVAISTEFMLWLLHCNIIGPYRYHVATITMLTYNIYIFVEREAILEFLTLAEYCKDTLYVTFLGKETDVQ